MLCKTALYNVCMHVMHTLLQTKQKAILHLK